MAVVHFAPVLDQAQAGGPHALLAIEMTQRQVGSIEVQQQVLQRQR
jgi:hypothetical protein